MIWIAVRLARPLRDLTAAAEGFEGRGEAPRVEPRGPADVRRAIHAFNAMSARVSAMFDEKDRMLGAIGHDLRTPLASLADPRREHRARGGAWPDDRDHRGNDRDARRHAGARPFRTRGRESAAGRHFRACRHGGRGIPGAWPRRDLRGRQPATRPRSSRICCAARCATSSTMRSNMPAQPRSRCARRRAALPSR